jgi:3-carboxy-cis,cis-muconate cycloisomerase
MAVSVFDHPFLSGLFGDDEAASCFTVEADIAAMLRFESCLAKAEAEEGVIPEAAAEAIAQGCAALAPDTGKLRAGTARDGAVVPALVDQLREAVGERHAADVHFGATSQDVVDTSLVLRLKPVLSLYRLRLGELLSALDGLAICHGEKPLLGRTRMQAAIPMTVADRLRSWRAPLARRLEDLAAVEETVLVLQFGGPVGTLEKLGDKGRLVRRRLAGLLDLREAGPWHSERDRFACLADWLSLMTGSLGKLGQDVALMAQNGIDEIELSGGGGSSSMSHKHNPVKAEALIALARFNAAQLSAMHQALVHEQERSGAAWALEWMVLPQMAMATSAALRTALDLVGSVQRMGSVST